MRENYSDKTVADNFCYSSLENVKDNADFYYDRPIFTIEKDNKKIFLYELIGISEENIKEEIEFVNKTCKTYLNVSGEFCDEYTGWKNDINICLPIDTEVYNSYECRIADGILYITLYEIKNEKPFFYKFG